MKFSVNTDTLLQAVQIVSRAVASKTSIPALTGIYFESLSDNEIILKGTDLEIGMEYTLTANIEEKGNMVVPTKYLIDILRKLPDTNLIFVLNEDRVLNIQYDDSQVSLNTYPVEQFSFLPEIHEEEVFKLDNEMFIDMIKKVSISFGYDISKPVLNGALFEVEDNKIRMVTSDTYRLSLVESNLSQKISDSLNPIIIPAKALIEISKYFSKEDFLNVILDEKQIQFENSDLKLRVRLIDGVFPPYKNVIPTEYSTKIIASTKEFLLSVERATVISGDAASKSNTIKLDISDNVLHISSYSPNIGQLNDKIIIDKEGEDITISFNGNYLTDILKIIDSEKVIFELTGNLSPGIIKPFEEENNFLSLILPVRS